jgi:hypothetical protein
LSRQTEDRRILEELIRFLEKKEPSVNFTGQLVIEIGQFFLGAPYAGGTLETIRAERLIVNLRELDCFTFVENVVALAWQLKSGKKNFGAFRRLLRKIRYRQGRLQGLSSRLHYFSDWIHDNEKKGILRDVTAEIGGEPIRKVLNFMTAHPERYPALKHPTTFRKMKSVEKRISRRSRFFVPKTALRSMEDRIQDGDLIAITTNMEGIDIHHVGLAARLNNRIHLLHASSMEGKVVFSEETLYRYLMQSPARSGTMVARVR